MVNIDYREFTYYTTVFCEKAITVMKPEAEGPIPSHGDDGHVEALA